MAGQEKEAGPRVPFRRSWYGIVIIALGVVTVYFLLTEHLSHVLSAVPFVLLLSCPIMHFFMHGRHGRHGRHAPDPAAGA